jgi:Ca2+-binding RTX toxin-like protein
MRRIAYPLVLIAALVIPVATGQGRGLAPQPTKVFGATPDTRFGGPGGLSVFATDAANEIAVRLDPGSGRYIVTDPAGTEPGNSYCVGISSTSVSCEVLGGRIFAAMRGGTDSLSVGSEVAGPVDGSAGAGNDRVALAPDYPGRVTFRGGNGADLLAGGTQRDRLIGQNGKDRLKGRGGDDRIKGEKGRDEAGGGSGDDRLVMSQNDRDKTIDCGSGDDRAIIDRDLDPDPRHCERIASR